MHVGEVGVFRCRVSHDLRIRAVLVPGVPLVLILVVKHAHVAPEQVDQVGGHVGLVLLQQPLDGQDQVGHPSLSPPAVNIGSAAREPEAAVLQHGIGENHETGQRCDHGPVPGRVSLGQLRQTEEERGAGPEVPLGRRFGTDPAVRRLQAEDGTRHGVHLALEPVVVQGVGQRHQAVKPVRQRLVQVAVVAAVPRGRQPARVLHEAVEVVLVPREALSHCAHLAAEPSQRLDGAHRQRVEYEGQDCGMMSATVIPPAKCSRSGVLTCISGSRFDDLRCWAEYRSQPL